MAPAPALTGARRGTPRSQLAALGHTPLFIAATCLSLRPPRRRREEGGDARKQIPGSGGTGWGGGFVRRGEQDASLRVDALEGDGQHLHGAWQLLCAEDARGCSLARQGARAVPPGRQMQSICSVEAIVRSMAAFRLPGANKDHLVLGSDSGRISVLEFNTERNQLERVRLETLGKSG
jgi:hypothetical protein